MESNSNSKYINLYKNNNEKEERQEHRRRALLDQQKEQRSLIQDKFRKITRHKNSIYHMRPKTYCQKYGQDHKLQLSEWLKERPDDLTRWFLVPCPRGQRCMLVACDGITEMYSKNGRYMFSFHSMLHGDGISYNDFTILDCIYDKNVNTYYVLDALALGNHDLLECETEFRQFWIKSKFSEYPDLDLINSKNEYSIKLLHYYDFEKENSIAECFNRYPQWSENKPQLDGFLFYHKDSSYVCGTTPLVGWLFPFMINEVLNISINEGYILEKPKNYQHYLHFIEVFDEDLLKKNKNKQKKFNILKMDEDLFVDEDSLDSKNDDVDILHVERELELSEIC